MTHELGKLWSDEGAGKPQLEGGPAGGYCPQLVRLQECSGTCGVFSSKVVEKTGFSSWHETSPRATWWGGQRRPQWVLGRELIWSKLGANPGRKLCQARSLPGWNMLGQGDPSGGGCSW